MLLSKESLKEGQDDDFHIILPLWSVFTGFSFKDILTTDKICREYRASRSREAAYFLMRLCA